MSLRIQNNVEAFNASRMLVGNSDRLAKSMEKLSSGYRINRGAEDAAGLAISEKLRGQIGGLGQATRNTHDAISMVQTAEGALNEVHSMLQRVRELAVQYKNGTLGTNDRQAIQSEVDQLKGEIERIGSETNFNGIDLLKSASTTISFQVGASDQQQITVATISVGVEVGLQHRHPADRRRDQQHLGRPRQVRRRSEPARAHDREPGLVPGEPDRLREPDPRRGHGRRDGQVHEVPDPPAGQHLDAGPGEPGAAGRPVAAALGAGLRPCG
jgi:hypothetical protein